MKWITLCERFGLGRKLCVTVFSVFALIFSVSGMAAEINITARFLPNANNPNQNRFENTTPISGYCVNFAPHCGGLFSIAIPNRTSQTPLISGQGVAISVPRTWRELDVTHVNGTTQRVKFRVVSLGAGYRLSQPPPGGHFAVWNGGTWIYPPAGCGSTSVGSFNSTGYWFFWHFQSANPCTKIARVDMTPGIFFQEINFMYEMETPDPLAMSIGNYVGSLTYTIGPDGDFRFGDATATDSILKLNFSLSVQHTLRVVFPAAADSQVLQPQGGWQQWLNGGEKFRPKKLIANQSFQQWASTRFKMQLQCEYQIGDDCALQNTRGDNQVAVKTLVSLPFGLQDSDKKPVARYPLSSTVPSFFQPTRYVNNDRATLHFEVEKEGVDQMIDQGGGRYRGNVTIVWDSAV